MVGFAVVGLGMGRGRAKLITQTEGARLSCVCDLRDELAREVGEELSCDWTSSLDDALARDDVDAVLVMTPSGLHAKIGVQVAHAGKHVITTKPMDVSTAACDELIEAAASTGVLLGIDYQSRYVDTNFRVASALQQGLFGRPLLGEVRFKWFRSDEYFQHGGGWRGTWAMDGGGSLANQGSHLIDLLLWFMGDPDEVFGDASIMNHDIETEDVGLALLRYGNGARGVIVGTTTFPANAYFSAEVHGTDGGVLIDGALDGSARYFGDDLEQKLAAIDNPIHNIVEDVVSAVTHGTQLRVDGFEGRRTVALLETIYASSKARKALSLGQSS